MSRSACSTTAEAGPVVGAIVDADPYRRRAQLVGDGCSGREHVPAILLANDRHDHGLMRRHARREPQPAVVPVGHDDAADQPRRRAP